MRNWLEMNQSTIILARGEIASVLLRGRECRISCVTGTLWVTMSGRAEDSVLGPGEQARFRGKGRIVVQALRTAAVLLQPSGHLLDSPADGERERHDRQDRRVA